MAPVKRHLSEPGSTARVSQLACTPELWLEMAWFTSVDRELLTFVTALNSSKILQDLSALWLLKDMSPAGHLPLAIGNYV